jgi:CRP-like cAMP-binding protein
MDGAIDILVEAGQAAITVASLFPGQYFGELSLFDGMPRSATATATKPTRLLWLGRDDLIRFFDAAPERAMRILREMSNRMRKTNELLSSQVSRDVVVEHDEKLTFGDRIADKVASFGGSWAFIACFVGVITVWLLSNLFLPYDRPGFMLLNLVLAVWPRARRPSS